MKFLFSIFLFAFVHVSGQTKKSDLFNLIKKISLDSSRYESVGDWSISKTSAYPIKWQSDRLEMSDDLKINFFRKGTTKISINGNKPYAWTIMLKGARAGYSSFSIISPNLTDIKTKISLDSLFGKNQYTYTLLQNCSSNPVKGFYFYQLNIPKKIMTWLKLSWVCNSASCVLTLDIYDSWSKQYADLNCK
jgi:hypothetical protein